jgi:hypothetical protein
MNKKQRETKSTHLSADDQITLNVDQDCKVTIEIPLKMAKAIQELCEEVGITMYTFFIEALEHEISRHKSNVKD